MVTLAKVISKNLLDIICQPSSAQEFTSPHRGNGKKMFICDEYESAIATLFLFKIIDVFFGTLMVEIMCVQCFWVVF